MRRYLIIIVMMFLAAMAVGIYARQKSDEAISFNTKDIAPEVKGIGGHIEMMVELDGDGKIKEVTILDHNEAPEYTAGITGPDFLVQFKGKGVDDAFIVGEDIDAITGATISSKAVSETLKTCLERVVSKVETEPHSSGIVTRLEKAGLEPREAKYYEIVE